MKNIFIIFAILFLFTPDINAQNIPELECHNCETLRNQFCENCTTGKGGELFNGFLITHKSKKTKIYSPFEFKYERGRYHLKGVNGKEYSFLLPVKFNGVLISTESILLDAVSDCRCQDSGGDPQLSDGVTILGDGSPGDEFRSDTINEIATKTDILNSTKFIDGTDPVDAVYLDGNTGIGTVTPDALLDVEGGTVRFSDYGDGTVTGTETQLLGVNSDGDIIEVSSAQRFQKESYFDFEDANLNVTNSNLNPNDNVSIQKINNNYQLQSSAIFPADSLLTIPVLNKGWENLFSYSNQFGTEDGGTSWNDLGSLYEIIEDDAAHPLGVGGSRGFVMTNTSTVIAYGNDDFKNNIYEPDSTYTISFWAKQGNRAQDSNTDINVQLSYSGNPDPNFTIGLTSEWIYYNVTLTALEVARTFNFVSINITGDVGDKVNITDVQLNHNTYTGQNYYETTTDLLETTDSIFLNYKLVNGGIDYTDFRNIKGEDGASINYLSAACQTIEGCGAIYFHGVLNPTTQILVREHVSILGDFNSAASTGSDNYLLASSRVVADLDDITKSVFLSVGTDQIAGTELGGFVFENLSPAKAIWESDGDLGSQIHNIHVAKVTVETQFGFLFAGTSSIPLNVVIDNCKIQGAVTGIYGNAVNTIVSNTKLLECDTVANITGGQWVFDNCWFEKMDNTGLVFDGDRLSINDVYVESVPKLGVVNGAIFDIQKADIFNVTNASLHNQPAADISTNHINLDSVGAINLTAIRFNNVGGQYITTTEATGKVIVSSYFVNNFSRPYLFDANYTGIFDRTKVINLSDDENWIPRLETEIALISDSYLKSLIDSTTIEGNLRIWADTIPIRGTQNLFTDSENLITPAWVLLLEDVGNIFEDFDGTAELFVPDSQPSTLQAINFGSIGNGYNLPNKRFTVSYDARKASDFSVHTIYASLAAAGIEDDVNSEVVTLTSSWVRYTHTLVSTDVAYNFNFHMDGDSILIRNVSITEGYLNEEYRMTTTTAIENPEVVFNGSVSITDNVRFSDYGAGTKTGTATYNLSVDVNGDIIETVAGAVLENLIVVNQSNFSTTLGGTIDPDKEYFLDGNIDMGTTTITVPSGGINIKGFDFKVSGLFSTENNYTLFISAVGGSGDILLMDFKIDISGTTSQVFNLEADTGVEAFEMNMVNFNNCTSLGEVDGYRQGLETGTGRFGGTPELTLSGTWSGGYFISTSICRDLIDGSYFLYKEGTVFTMASRFRSNANMDLNASVGFVDFVPANFPNANTLQFTETIIARNGLFDPTDATLIPNIGKGDIASSWRNNIGIDNTHVGGELDLTSETLTSITVLDQFETLLGTFTSSDLQHFDSPSNGQLRHLAETPREYSFNGNLIIDGTANDILTVRIRRWDDSASGFVTELTQTRKINPFSGTDDFAFFLYISRKIILDQDDYIFLEVANTSSGSNDITLKIDSYFIVEER